LLTSKRFKWFIIFNRFGSVRPLRTPNWSKKNGNPISAKNAKIIFEKGVTGENIYFSRKLINSELKTFILFKKFYLVVENLKSWRNGTDFCPSSC